MSILKEWGIREQQNVFRPTMAAVGLHVRAHYGLCGPEDLCSHCYCFRIQKGRPSGASKDIIQQLQRPTDQDCTREDVRAKVDHKWQELQSQSPILFNVTISTKDLLKAPKVGLVDILNYLIERRSDFDKRKAKAYNSFEDYQLFLDRHVAELKCVLVKNKVCVCSASENPPQRHLRTSL